MEKLLLIVNIFLISCAVHNQNNFRNLPGYQIIAQKKWGSSTQFLFNTDSSFVICLKQAKPTAKNPLPRLSFFIYDINKERILFEDSFENGTIHWMGPYQVEVIPMPGTVTVRGAVYSWIYDLKNKKRYQRKRE
ncbi:MAG: hypothetical protein D6813_09800 [Calditrichaeota bacterium]|nr:MAG: hypothetical protein D6813_09800 [Calditrichota bacterium]